MIGSPLPSRGVVAGRAGAPPTVEDILVHPPGPGEARLRIEASGLCHTDLMVSDGVWWSGFPYLLGHEGVGVVESTGAGVDPDLVGRRMLAAWRAVCGRCRFCAAGRERLCADLPQARPRAVGADGRAITGSLRIGSHARHTVVDARQLVPVPAGAPAETLCLIGCGVLTGYGAVVNTAEVAPGMSVAVIGCGSVGLNIVQAARSRGAGPIVAVDPDPAKLALAARFGATDMILAGDDTAPAVRARTGGHGADVVFDVVGSTATMRAAVAAADLGAAVVLVGTPSREARWDLALGDMFHRRLRILNCQYGDVLPTRDTAAVLDLYSRGLLDLDAMVSSVIPLEEAPAALADLRAGRPGVRTVIRMDLG